MKTKIISLIFLMAFVTTAFDCNPDPIKPPNTSPLFQELQGQYQSDDGYVRLTLNTNRYTLYLGGSEREGNYHINAFSHVELNLIDGFMAFEIRRDPNEQIIGLTETLNGDPVLHRMGQEEHFISYDNLDMEVIRQNLGGRYRSTTNGQYMILELDNVHNMYSMQRDGQNYFGDYTIECTTSGVLLVLHLENESEEYYLHIIENSIERITSRNIGIQEGLRREVPPTNSNDSEISYGIYSSQNRSFGHYNGVPNAFDYCRERLATLFGRYEDNGTSSISMIEITPSVMHLTINNERISVNYTVEFRSINGLNHSSIRFEIGEQTYRFRLIILLDNTIIGLISNTIHLAKTQYYHATVTLMGDGLHINGGIN